MKPAHDKRADSGATAIENIAQTTQCPNLMECQRWYACDEVGPFCRSCWRSHNRLVTAYEAGGYSG